MSSVGSFWNLSEEGFFYILEMCLFKTANNTDVPALMNRLYLNCEGDNSSDLLDRLKTSVSNMAGIPEEGIFLEEIMKASLVWNHKVRHLPRGMCL